MKFNIKSIKNRIINNKKQAILIGTALLFAIVILANKNGRNETPDFFASVKDLHDSSFVGDGTITISDKDITMSLCKSKSDYMINAKYNEYDCPQVLTRKDNMVYVGSSVIDKQSNILTMGIKNEKKSLSIVDVLINAASSSSYPTYSTEGNKMILSVNDTEAWKGFWSDISTSIESNSDALKQYYEQSEENNVVLQALIEDINRLKDTNTIANSLTISITPTENGFLVEFDSTLDLSLLPHFAVSDNIDSNKIKCIGFFTITKTDSVSIEKPTGSIHLLNNEKLQSFLNQCWNILFDKSEYVSYSNVSVTSDSVSSTITLGDTTETLQLKFSADGVSEGMWYIVSKQEDVIKTYIDTYSTNDIKENFIKLQDAAGNYTLSIKISKSGLDSYNKIATTPKKMGDYLGGEKGVDIIV